MSQNTANTNAANANAASFLCILSHNVYRNIRKGCCYAPQMRQDLDKYSHRNVIVIKHQKGDFRVLEL